MATMTTAERDAFLAQPRFGMLSTLRGDGSPVTVPVWFEWDGEVVRVFAGADSGKIARIQRDPRASLLVANHISETESWVAFDGPMTIATTGAFELAARLAGKYWNMTDPARVATVETWREAAEFLRLLEMRPQRIRTSLG